MHYACQHICLFGPQVEGCPEYMEESHQLSENDVIVGSKPNFSEESVSLVTTENDWRDHVGGGLHVTDMIITEELKELHVGLGQKQEMVECSKKEEYKEKVILIPVECFQNYLVLSMDQAGTE